MSFQIRLWFKVACETTNLDKNLCILKQEVQTAVSVERLLKQIKGISVSLYGAQRTYEGAYLKKKIRKRKEPQRWERANDQQLNGLSFSRSCLRGWRGDFSPITTRMTQFLIKYDTQSGGNLSFFAGHPFVSTYCASKHALQVRNNCSLRRI